MAYENLRFFDKNGKPLNFKQSDDGVWEGSLHFHVSQNLIENEIIHIFEMIENNSVLNLYKPHMPDGADTDTTWTYSFETVKSEYRFYSLTQSTNSLDNFYTTSITGTQEIDRDPAEIVNPGGYKVSAVINSEPISLRLSFQPTDDSETITYLLVKDFEQTVCRIELYGVGVVEDERMKVLLNNFGKLQYFTPQDENILKSSDIKEELPNWKNINQKRKEMLLFGDEMIDHQGTYIAIIRALLFFGYTDVRIKEEWVRDDDGMKILRDINHNTRSITSSKNIDPKTHTKTAQFSLFYDIIRETGDINEFGIPLTERNSQFTFEEIYIKLYSLKKWIENNIVSGVGGKIIDIVGEAIYFHSNDINLWSLESLRTSFEHQIQASFVIEEKEGNIQDVRPNLYTPSYSGDAYINATDDPDITIGSLFDNYLSEFAHFETNPFYYDADPTIEVGFPLKVTNTTFSQTWGDYNGPWSMFNSLTFDITWGNISSYEYPEMEWSVVREYDDTIETFSEFSQRTFNETKRGTPESIESHTFILPYTGTYSVSLRIFDYRGGVSKKEYYREIKVGMFNPEPIAFGKFNHPSLNSFEKPYLKWGEAGGDWGNGRFVDGRGYIFSEAEIEYRNTNTAFYLDANSFNIEGFGFKHTWGDFPINTWNDFTHSSWDSYNLDTHKRAFFVINDIRGASRIQIGDSEYQLPVGVGQGNFNLAAQLLSSIDTGNINDYYYIPIPESFPTQMLCVHKTLGKNTSYYIGGSGGIEFGDEILKTWDDFDQEKWIGVNLKWGNLDSIALSEYKTSAFSMDDIKFFEGAFRMPLCTPIIIRLDKSKILSKTSYEWKITDSSGNTVLTHSGDYIFYTFKVEDVYDLEVTVTDINGNKASVLKEGFIRVQRELEEVSKEYCLV